MNHNFAKREKRVILVFELVDGEKVGAKMDRDLVDSAQVTFLPFPEFVSFTPLPRALDSGRWISSWNFIYFA